jgi:hypothetical protein
MKKRVSRSDERGEQMIMTEIVTEEDVVRAYMRKIGRKGGSQRTPAQRKAAQKGIDAMLKKRGITRREDGAG